MRDEPLFRRTIARDPRFKAIFAEHAAKRRTKKKTAKKKKKTAKRKRGA